MIPNVLEILEEKLEELSPSGQRIAAFVMDNPEDTVYLSAAELSYRCGVSESGVIRFCKSLSMESYRHFRLGVLHSVALRSQSSQKPAESALPEMEPMIAQITSAAEQLSGCIQQLTSVLSRNSTEKNDL